MTMKMSRIHETNIVSAKAAGRSTKKLKNRKRLRLCQKLVNTIVVANVHRASSDWNISPSMLDLAVNSGRNVSLGIYKKSSEGNSSSDALYSTYIGFFCDFALHSNYIWRHICVLIFVQMLRANCTVIVFPAHTIISKVREQKEFLTKVSSEAVVG